MKRTGKQIGSLALAVCMVLTLLPVAVFADTGDMDSGAPPLGASETITAFADLDEDIAAQTVENGTPENELNLPDTLAATVVGAAASGGGLPEPETRTVDVSGWTAAPAYDGNTEGDYTFTPDLDLPDGLTVAEGVHTPAITVTVTEAAAPALRTGGIAPMSGGSVTGTMTIGDTTVSDLTANAGNLDANGWSWNAAAATLTLASNYGGQPIAINCTYTTDTINLEYSGDVSITSADASTIYCEGNLNITGSGGMLTLNSTSGNSLYCAIEVYGALTIGGNANVDATCAGSGTYPDTEAAVIYGTWGVTVSGSANVTATATGNDASGILVEGGDITISTSGTVTANGRGAGGALAIFGGNTLNMTGGNLVLTGRPLYGDYVAAPTISGGSITIDSTAVYLVEATLSGVSDRTEVTSVSSSVSAYGVFSRDTNTSGKLYFLLPVGTQTVTLTAAGNNYTGTVDVTTDNGATATLTTDGPVFFAAATATFALANLPAGNTSGGSGDSAWTWDNTNKNLTLAGTGPYTLTGTASSNMQVKADTAVELTLNGASFTNNSGFIALYLQYGGTLTVTADSQVTGGISGGSGSLAIVLDDADLDVDGEWNVIDGNDLSLAGSGTVAAAASGGVAVFCVGDLEVGIGCTLSASGKGGLQFQDSFSGVPVISGGGNITATGDTYYGIAGNSLTSSLTFDFTGGLEITGATYGIDMLKTDTATVVSFVSAPRSLTINSVSGIIGSSQGGTVALQNNANIPGLSEVFNAGGTSFPIAPAPAYLKVLGVAVNDANKDQITGPGISGGVSYNPATKTLTLNNAVIAPSAPVEHGIFSADDLTVRLIGQNRIGTAPGNPARQDAYLIQTGISGGKSVSLTGDGSLTVYDGDTGILAIDSLTVDLGSSLTVVEYGFEGKACCLRTDGPLTINRGTLNLTSYNSKGIKGGSIVINGGVISAQTQGNSGHFAFNTEPTFGGSYDHQVFAGENAASAAEVTSPTAATFTASKYVRIQPQGGGSGGDGGSTGGGGGGGNVSTAPPTSANVGADGSVSQTQIAREAAAALGTAVGSTATLRTMNAQSITPAALKAMADAGAKAGKKVVLHADTMQGNAVQGRLYVRPEALLNAKDPIQLGVYTEPAKTAATTAMFEKYFDNKVATVSFEQQGSFGARLEVAAKVDLTGMDVTKLVIYSYDKATNSYTRIANPAYWVDANGYLHFYTAFGGSIIITDKPLTRK